MNTASGIQIKSSLDDLRIMTLQAHIPEQQAHQLDAGGTFSWMENVLGNVGTENVQSEKIRLMYEAVLVQLGTDNSVAALDQ
jgi:hypothetical protein